MEHSSSETYLTRSTEAADTPYGVSLDGTVRMVTRGAAVCQVLAENHSADVYEQMKANHGQPLHVWRLDYGVYKGSGHGLSQFTAHVRIESEWPP